MSNHNSDSEASAVEIEVDTQDHNHQNCAMFPTESTVKNNFGFPSNLKNLIDQVFPLPSSLTNPLANLSETSVKIETTLPEVALPEVIPPDQLIGEKQAPALETPVNTAPPLSRSGSFFEILKDMQVTANLDGISEPTSDSDDTDDTIIYNPKIGKTSKKSTPCVKIENETEINAAVDPASKTLSKKSKKSKKEAKEKFKLDDKINKKQFKKLLKQNSKLNTKYQKYKIKCQKIVAANLKTQDQLQETFKIHKEQTEKYELLKVDAAEKKNLLRNKINRLEDKNANFMTEIKKLGDKNKKLLAETLEKASRILNLENQVVEVTEELRCQIQDFEAERKKMAKKYEDKANFIKVRAGFREFLA